jgi:hypothetical protein
MLERLLRRFLTVPFLQVGVGPVFEMSAIHACDATKETGSQFWPFRQKRLHDRVMDDRFFAFW